jgi:hypothetical protein
MSAVIQAEPQAAVVPSARAVPGDRFIERTEWCLRIGAAACFIGHGAFGVITKEAWLPYFAVLGIGRDLAYTLMPVVGTIDITAGILMLVSPRPIVLLYMAIWGLWTAMLRPLAGESGFETLERAGNYGVPFALLLWYARPAGLRGAFQAATRRVSVDRVAVGRVLLGTTAILLFAHGALQAITHKPSFATLYGAVGLPASVATFVGGAEMLVALLVAVAPIPALLVAVAAWKLASESLFPLAGMPIWELVERGGSYGAPLALAVLCGTSPFTRINLSRRSQ